MADYIPSGDAGFHGRQQNFYSYINDHLTELGISPEELAPLMAAQD